MRISAGGGNSAGLVLLRLLVLLGFLQRVFGERARDGAAHSAQEPVVHLVAAVGADRPAGECAHQASVLRVRVMHHRAVRRHGHGGAQARLAGIGLMVGVVVIVGSVLRGGVGRVGAVLLSRIVVSIALGWLVVIVALLTVGVVRRRRRELIVVVVIVVVRCGVLGAVAALVILLMTVLLLVLAVLGLLVVLAIALIVIVSRGLVSVSVAWWWLRGLPPLLLVLISLVSSGVSVWILVLVLASLAAAAPVVLRRHLVLEVEKRVSRMGKTLRFAYCLVLQVSQIFRRASELHPTSKARRGKKVADSQFQRRSAYVLVSELCNHE